MIGSGTPDEVAEMLDENPDLTTIVLEDVPGSGDDEANLEASRLVREAGLATHVPADGFIYEHRDQALALEFVDRLV